MEGSLEFCMASFSCRSFKSSISISEIHELCCHSDLVFLQEHWLLPFELGLLNDVHPDFLAVGKSAVDISHTVLTGRPYGGTCIMFLYQTF
jgi:hypothetical protein